MYDSIGMSILKAKIEKQVKDILNLGLIRPSTNHFSSLILLIKKKTVPDTFALIIVPLMHHHQRLISHSHN